MVGVVTVDGVGNLLLRESRFLARADIETLSFYRLPIYLAGRCRTVVVAGTAGFVIGSIGSESQVVVKGVYPGRRG